MNGDPADVSQYMAWDTTGKLLIIPNEKDLVEQVCMVHFAQKSITSFVRPSLFAFSASVSLGCRHRD